MDKIKHLTLTLDKSQERGYIKVPFQVEKNTERIDIRYRYPSSPVSSEGNYCISGEPCTIDLAVMLPDGTMAGASGSDRNHVWLSPLGSSAGFLSGELPEGTWHIIAGAYHVPAEGVTVEYTLEFTEKKRRLFKGDTHVHTTASDGILTPEEAAGLAKRMGLDYLFFTDHNNSAQNENLPDCDDITLLPGTEWTHYKGHAGFLGVKGLSCVLISQAPRKKRMHFSGRRGNAALSVSSTILSALWYHGNGALPFPLTAWRYGMASCPNGMKGRRAGGMPSCVPAGGFRSPEAAITIAPDCWAVLPCPAIVCMRPPVPRKTCCRRSDGETALFPICPPGRWPTCRPRERMEMPPPSGILQFAVLRFPFFLPACRPGMKSA